jgi:hypothetical protein
LKKIEPQRTRRTQREHGFFRFPANALKSPFHTGAFFGAPAMPRLFF